MKHALEILQRGTFKTVKVVFIDHRYFMNAIPFGNEYVYKTDIDDICEGDTAIVRVNGSLKVVEIVEVSNDDSFIDYNSNFHYKWLVSKIDLEEHLIRERKEDELRAELDKRIVNSSRIDLLRDLATSGNSDFLLKEFGIDVKINIQSDQEENTAKEPIKFK